MTEIRPVVADRDLPGLERLFELVTRADGHRPIGEHVYLSLTTPGPGPAAGLVADRDGELIGYVGLTPSTEPGSWMMEFALHPLHRTPELRRRLILEGMEELHRRGARRVRVWTYHPDLAAGLLEEGFIPERELRQLRIGLPAPPPVFPAGVDVRGFRPGADEEEWLRVNNAAFAGHPENGAWTMDILRARERQSWFDPEGLRMAWDTAGLAGFCWTKRHEGPLGEIYVIAVAPDRRRRGLGRALVLEGLRYLHEQREATTGMLYVDAANQAGLDLYEWIGFRLHHVDRSFVRELEDQPGVKPVVPDADGGV